MVQDGTGMEETGGVVPCQALLPPAHADPDLRSLGILNLNLAFLYRWEGIFVKVEGEYNEQLVSLSCNV